jgi:hypothetical protein
LPQQALKNRCAKNSLDESQSVNPPERSGDRFPPTLDLGLRFPSTMELMKGLWFQEPNGPNPYFWANSNR